MRVGESHAFPYPPMESALQEENRQQWAPHPIFIPRTEFSSMTLSSTEVQRDAPHPSALSQRPHCSVLRTPSVSPGCLARPTSCRMSRVCFTFSRPEEGLSTPYPPLLEPDEAPIRPGAREIRKSSHSQFPTNLTLRSCCRKNKSPSTLEIPRNHSVLELQAPTRACSLTSLSSAPHPLCKWRN